MHLVDKNLPALPANFDMTRVIAGINRYFNPNRDDFLLSHHVSEVQNGYAYVSFAIPEQMFTAFISFFESMAKIFKVVEVKVRSVSAQNRVANISLDEIENRKKIHQDRVKLVSSRYDKFIQKGSTINEAISLTNRELKATGHVWCYYEGVKDMLREAGRFRRKSDSN